jgi:hypothetical protein
MMSEPVEFYGEIIAETDNAKLIGDGEHNVWIPNSLIIEQEKINGNDFMFLIPEWLAIDREIV